MLESVDGTLADLGDLGLELRAETILCLPERARHIQARQGRALLSLVLESTANRLNDGGTNISRRVNELPVLATSLSDHSRVRQVLVHVVGNRLPQRLEDGGRSSEVKTSKVLVRDGAVDKLDGVVTVGARKELDDVLGESSLEEDLVHEP